MLTRRAVVSGALALPLYRKKDARGGLWTPEVYDGSELARLYDPSQNRIQENGFISQLDDASPNKVPIEAFGFQGHNPPRLITNELAGYPVVEFSGRQFLDTEGSIGVNGNEFTIVQVWKCQNGDT